VFCHLTTEFNQRVPQKVLTLIRKVDEFKPLAAGDQAVLAELGDALWAERGGAVQVDPVIPAG